MKKLPVSFYQRENVLQIAKELLGKLLVSKWKGIVTSGRIVEVEAYNGVMDKASHAFGGRKTARNKIMYSNGGVAYIYLCYGIHHLFNVVTNDQDTPQAILIRALEPVKGIDMMRQRVGKKKPGIPGQKSKDRVNYSLTGGPGKLSKALGIFTRQSGCSLRCEELFIADDGFILRKTDIAASPRIGVDYAGNDALLPYRVYMKGNPFVSGKPK